MSTRRWVQEQEAVREKGKEKVKLEEGMRQAEKRKREDVEEQAGAAKETGIGARRVRRGNPLAQMWPAGDDEDEEVRRSMSILRFSR